MKPGATQEGINAGAPTGAGESGGTKKDVYIICTGMVCSAVVYTLIMLISLPASVNKISTGSANTTSAEAQVFYTMLFFLKNFASFLCAPLIGELGDVKGRRLLCIWAAAAYSTTGGLSLFAHIGNALLLHAVAQWLLGMFAPYSLA